MQPTPAQTARRTVDVNGGEYRTAVPDLLALFNRQQLTQDVRQEIRDALQSEGVGTDPDLLVAQPTDGIRLFVLERQWVASAPERVHSRPAGMSARQNRLRPRSWKGWLVYGLVLLLIIGAVAQDSDEPKQAVPAAQTVEESAPANESNAEAAAARRARREARRERAQLRRERAERRRELAVARRERRARRARAAARHERERQAAIAAQAAAPEPEPEAESLQANCHPSYDPCLDPNASDYDCEGGSGDGPEYTGLVTVNGSDDYDLDRDGDGTGCDS
jgi:pyruvate/2-oxoglutarate dehydrogenase complex dihydrolipoamide acyltransferase (E2) component